MNSLKFHEWIMKSVKQSSDERIKPDLAKENLLERLSGDNYTLDESILAVVHSVNGYESGNITNGKESFKSTIALINTLQPLIHDRVLLKGKLLVIKANLLHFAGDRSKAADTFDEAILRLHALHLEVDKNWVQAMLVQAHLFLRVGEKNKAENLYLDILSYPWTLIEEPEYFHMFQDYYLEAGKGLIECRRGNLVELRNIFFVPAANKILLPILEKAINEIQN